MTPDPRRLIVLPDSLDGKHALEQIEGDGLDLTPTQAQVLQEGLDAIARLNPPGLPGERASWLLWRWLEPAGLWSYRWENEQTVEIALNTWKGLSPRKLLLEWLAGIPAEVFLARVKPRNQPIRKFLQRGGFALVETDGKTEVHAVSKAHFCRLARVQAD